MGRRPGTDGADDDDHRDAPGDRRGGAPPGILARREHPELAFDPERFAAHERFFAEQVPAWAASRFGVDLPPDRTAVLGVSAGAELALAMGVRHPDRCGVVLAASPGAGYRPPRPLPRPLPRAYLVTGDGEPFFQANVLRWADALQDAEADVVIQTRAGGHGGAFWRTELPRMVGWAFGR